MADAEARVAEALTRALGSLALGAAALMGHAVVNRIILRQLLGLSEGAALRFTHPHNAIVVLEPEGSVFWLDDQGGSGLGPPWGAP